MTRARLAALAGAALLLTACSVPPPVPPADAPQTPAPTPVQTEEVAEPAPTAATSAQELLAALPVKGRAAMTGYDRDDWDVWSDWDGDGCDERQDTLARDMADVVLAGDGCEVLSGTLDGPYTGQVIAFVDDGRGGGVDIDHVVSLGNAHATGAFAWDDQTRRAFASDPRNLLAVDASANRQKGDGDAATWLPPNKSFRCQYATIQVEVKSAYGLWVTPPEADALAGLLAACP